MATGRWSGEGVLEDCDKAIELAKGDPIALQMRGTLLLNAGHFERAVEDLKKVDAIVAGADIRRAT